MDICPLSHSTVACSCTQVIGSAFPPTPVRFGILNKQQAYAIKKMRRINHFNVIFSFTVSQSRRTVKEKTGSAGLQSINPPIS